MTIPPIAGSDRIHFAVRALIFSLGLGVAGDLLVHDVAYGVGVSVFCLLVAGVSAWLFPSRIANIERPARLLVVPIGIFALLFSWHDSNELRLLNAFCLALLVGLMTWRAGQPNLVTGRIMEYLFVPIGEWGRYVNDFFRLLQLEGAWKRPDRAKSGKSVLKVLLGLCLALPFLLIFGALFASADAEFARMLQFSFDGEEFFAHGLAFAVYTIVVGGFLVKLFLAPRTMPDHSVPKPPPFGIIEIATVLLALDLLFGLFVATQFRHFFGGNELVRSTAHLGYADYARRGFFELSTVTALTVPVLLGSYALLNRTSARDMRIYSGLATILVVLVFAVISSAWLRMRLYVDAYGITSLRLYVFAAIAWIGATFACFATTVLRGRPERFAFGALSLFVGGVFVLNLVNPDRLIASINTHRSGEALDAQYLRGLSLDSVPVLAEALPRLAGDDQAAVQDVLARHKQGLGSRDPRSWNLATGSAASILGKMKLPEPKETESEDYEEATYD